MILAQEENRDIHATETTQEGVGGQRQDLCIAGNMLHMHMQVHSRLAVYAAAVGG